MTQCPASIQRKKSVGSISTIEAVSQHAGFETHKPFAARKGSNANAKSVGKPAHQTIAHSRTSTVQSMQKPVAPKVSMTGSKKPSLPKEQAIDKNSNAAVFNSTMVNPRVERFADLELL